jgi:hypothetical protein
MILLPFFKRFAGIAQCAKQRFVEAFVSRFAVEAFKARCNANRYRFPEPI